MRECPDAGGGVAAAPLPLAQTAVVMAVKQNDCTMKLRNGDILNLYKIVIEEEHFFAREHQSRIEFFVGIISALMTVTVVGAFRAKIWYEYLFVIVGPILILVVSEIAIEGTFRLYRRFLESITMRAKIEQIIGLTKETVSHDRNEYWPSEPIIPSRYLQARHASTSSEEFIEKLSKAGYHKNSKYLFRVFQIVSVIMFLSLIFLSILKR